MSDTDLSRLQKESVTSYGAGRVFAAEKKDEVRVRRESEKEDAELRIIGD